MLIIDEIIKQLGSIERFRDVGYVRIRRGERQLLLEYIGFGPTSADAVRLARYGDGGLSSADPELHFEWKNTVWLPYYYRNERTDSELFLYSFIGARDPLRLNAEQADRLIEISGILDLNLWAEGFVDAARDVLQGDLFACAGGAS